MSDVKLRDDGKYDAECPVCGQESIVSRVRGEGDSVETTPAENHNAVCRGKMMLSGRKEWPKL